MDDDTVSSAAPRSAEQLAKRAIALHCVIAAAHGVSKQNISDWLHDEDLWCELTRRELKFMDESPNSDREVAWMSWFAEAQFTLLWAICKIDDLPPPMAKCNTRLIFNMMPGLFKETATFIESATLRPHAQIEHEYEETYDAHCDVRAAIRAGVLPPDGVDKDVLFFRQYALEWLTGPKEESWDEVTPDT